jgi:hypothetical protein
MNVPIHQFHEWRPLTGTISRKHSRTRESRNVVAKKDGEGMVGRKIRQFGVDLKVFTAHVRKQGLYRDIDIGVRLGPSMQLPDVVLHMLLGLTGIEAPAWGSDTCHSLAGD